MVSRQKGRAKPGPARQRKLKVGSYWAAACGGCDIALLEIHEKLLELIEKVDIVFWPCVMDFKRADVEAMADGAMDVCLFHGAIRNTENAQMARLLRRKAKVMIAYGACSSWGGIPALGNSWEPSEIVACASLCQSAANPKQVQPNPSTRVGAMHVELPALLALAQPLRNVVTVDYSVPGCPPVDKQTWNVLKSAISGRLPPRGSVLGAGSKSVCDECRLPKRHTKIQSFRRRHEFVPEPDWCLLEQGVVCLGPATRSGCEAQCTTANMPCRGCYGPTAGDNDVGARMIAVLGSILQSQDEAQIERVMAELLDPVGTFYRYTLATSILSATEADRRPSPAHA
jgi:F420-non-reducing hydrogenase small subunit